MGNKFPGAGFISTALNHQTMCTIISMSEISFWCHLFTFSGKEKVHIFSQYEFVPISLNRKIQGYDESNSLDQEKSKINSAQH